MEKHNKLTNPETKMVSEMKEGIVRNDRIAVILSSISALVLAVFSVLISVKADCIDVVSWILGGIGVAAGIATVDLAFSYPSDQRFQKTPSNQTTCEVERKLLVENENKIMLEENKAERRIIFRINL